MGIEVAAFFSAIGSWISANIATSILIASIVGGAIAYLTMPDMPDSSLGEADISQLVITTAKEGDPIPDLVGTSKVVGNIIYYYGERNEDDNETGYGHKYYLSWLQGLCTGPVDKLYAVYLDDKLVWFGDLERPVSGGMETIVLRDITGCSQYTGAPEDWNDNLENFVEGDVLGTVNFYFGTEDQEASLDYLKGNVDELNNLPYKGLCYAHFEDYFIGTYNRAPVVKFIIGKYPKKTNDTPFFNNSNYILNTYDYNPAHAIWYIFTVALDIPEELLNAESFSTAADILLSENCYVDIYFKKEDNAESYLKSVLFHIRGITHYDTDGQVHLKLLRQPTEDFEDLYSLNTNAFVDHPTVQRGTWGETVNEVKGNYPLRIVTSPEV